MKFPTRARSARTGVLAVTVALALATGGLAYGSSVDDDGSSGSSTRGAQTARPAPAGTGSVPETTNLQPKRGIKPSETVPKGSTRDTRPPANRNPDLKGKRTTVVDKSDRGKKNLPVTRDRGTKNLPVQRDLGDR
jgi:hypothetical protein